MVQWATATLLYSVPDEPMLHRHLTVEEAHTLEFVELMGISLSYRGCSCDLFIILDRSSC
jgi:hypothetical protein